MKIRETPIQDLLILEPKIFKDPRGYFFEIYNQKTFSPLGLDLQFVQDNESFSNYGTLRGLHFQKGAYAQAKLVRAVQGEIWDVAVDLRATSPTFGKSFGTRLSSENKNQFFIPRGFAHGFVVLSESALVCYKCDNFYSPENEGGIHFADPDLAVDWIIKPEEIVVSDKDRENPSFRSIREQL